MLLDQTIYWISSRKRFFKESSVLESQLLWIKKVSNWDWRLLDAKKKSVAKTDFSLRVEATVWLGVQCWKNIKWLNPIVKSGDRIFLYFSEKIETLCNWETETEMFSKVFRFCVMAWCETKSTTKLRWFLYFYFLKKYFVNVKPLYFILKKLSFRKSAE